MRASEGAGQRRAFWLTAGLLFLLLLARACAWGARYWPQLDDYIQMHNYLQHESFAALQAKVGVLGARPLAGLLDYFFWGRMFSFLIVGVALISLLYALTAVLLRSQLGRYFSVSPLFLVIFTLLPLGVEGTYWMSASTRVVCGLFCAALAAQAFLKWMDTGRWPWALAFGVLQVLPMGFYEQAGLFAATLTVGLAILEVSSSRMAVPRALVSLWSLPALGLYFLVTRLLTAGHLYSGRSVIVLPTDPAWRESLLPEVLRQFKEVFWTGNLRTLLKGFVRGVEALCSGAILPAFLTAACLCLLLGLVLGRRAGAGEEGKQLSPWLALAAGALLFVAPLTVFLVLENPWFSFRGAVTSFAGAALVCDTVITALWRFLPGRRYGPAAAAALLALVFWTAGASEVGDYRLTWQADQQVGLAAVEVLKEDFPRPRENDYSQRIAVLNVLPSYLEDQNCSYHEHIHGCTESSWAFQGLLTCLGGEGTWNVTPLPLSPMYYHWNQATNRPETFDVLYWYDGETIFPVELEQTGEHQFRLTDHQGRVLGRIWEEADGKGYFAPEEGENQGKN